MFTESRKIHLIEELIKTNDDDVLNELEAVLNRQKSSKKAVRPSAHDFLGVWSKKDAQLISKAIGEGCEQINPDDWK